MLKQLIILFITITPFICVAQKFPGGLDPMERREFVLQKIAVEGGLSKQMTADQLRVATPITINGITFTTVWIFFESDRLVSMVLNIPSTSDQKKIISILSKKYNKTTCYQTTDVVCFRNGNIKITIGNELDLEYHYDKQESF